MTSSHDQQWPLLNNRQPATATLHDAPVAEPERDRAERFLHQALRDGRLDPAEFERRFTSVMNAARVSQVAAAVSGVGAPVSQALVQVNDQLRVRGQAAPARCNVPAGSGAAAFAHFSGLFSWILGPALIYSASRPGSVNRREAAKAFNFQFVAGIAFVAVSIVLGGVLGLGGLVGLAWLAWGALTVIGGVKAANGEDWTNPLSVWTRIRVLPTE